MRQRLLTFLRQPYPAPEPWAAQWRRAVLIGVFVGLFLIVFQPFDTNRWQTPHKALKLLGFGAVTTLVTALNLLVRERLWPRSFREGDWTVGRALLAIQVNVLLIALANYLYLQALIHQPLSLRGVLGMTVVTFLVAVFPVSALVLTTYIRRLRHYQQAAAALHPQPVAAPTEAVAPAPTFTLTSENEKDRLTLTAAELLAIESSDNYCTVAYQRPGGALTRVLLRSSLTRLEGQLPPNGSIVRCHRSFLVNLDQVERVSGNAQGYRLHLRGGEVQVPVARKYNDTLVAGLKANEQ